MNKGGRRMNLATVILAAGKGTRMKSKTPKVLHNICGSTMLSYVIDAADGAGVKKIIVVVGYGADWVAREVEGRAQVAHQAEQLGTAHALMQAGTFLSDFKGQLIVLCLSLIHISEPTRRTPISYAVFCLKKKKIQLI